MNRVDDIQEFKRHLREILLFDDGLAIHSEGTVYVRSLEGPNFAAGILADDGGIEHETVFKDDLDGAINYFVMERDQRNHGADRT